MAADSLMQRDTIRIEMAEKRKWHIVKPGQTYYAIANLYGITLQQLYTWNNLSEKIPLRVGQQLIVAYSREKPDGHRHDAQCPGKAGPPCPTNQTGGYALYPESNLLHRSRGRNTVPDCPPEQSSGQGSDSLE